MKTLLTLFAAAGLAVAALAVPKWTKPQQEVADVFKAWAGAELAGDVDREMSLFTPAFTMWDFSTPAPMDFAAVRQQTVEIFKQSKVTACVIEPDSIRIEGDVAVVHGHFTEALKDAAGVSTEVGGPWSALLTRDKGKWLVAGLSYVSQPPPGASSSPAAAPTAAAEKQNVLDQFAALDAQDYKRYRELMPEDAVIHIVGAPEPFKRESLIAFIQEYWKAFPDTAHTIREAVVEGDTVVLHVTCQGTHRGAYEGVAPTGKTIRYDGVHIVRFQQGRVHEWWIMDDSLGLMQQLGLQLTAVTPAAAQELIGLENDWARAYVAKDLKALGRLEADDWVCTTWEGEVFGRSEDMADLENGTYAAAEFKVEELKVVLHGDTAVVTGRQTEKAAYKGKDASGVFRITDTWLRRDGRWQCIASHLSKIAAP